MLSKNDFKKELGKSIYIYPFYEKNIKDNSINLSIGNYAWALGEGSVAKDKDGNFVLVKADQQQNIASTITSPKNRRNSTKIRYGESAIRTIGGDKYLILLPRVTTAVETREVIGVNNCIGGTLHSKVGVVAQGIGDIGTMLGPCYCGHLLISLHNVSDKVVAIPVGETFVSVVFHYLNTPAKNEKNPNMSGHVDKLSELGVKISAKTREFLTEDWKQREDGIRDKMLADEGFKEFQKKAKREKNEYVKSFFNLKNSLIIVGLALLAVLFGWLAYKVKTDTGESVWVDRYWTVVSSAIVVPLVGLLTRQIKPKK